MDELSSSFNIVWEDGVNLKDPGLLNYDEINIHFDDDVIILTSNEIGDILYLIKRMRGKSKSLNIYYKRRELGIMFSRLKISQMPGVFVFHENNE